MSARVALLRQVIAAAEIHDDLLDLLRERQV
jgi:hypothetical protein